MMLIRILQIVVLASLFPAGLCGQDKVDHKSPGMSGELQWVTPEVKATRVSFHTFKSEAAKADVSYHVYTPSAYDESKTARFPVLYWLHGTEGGVNHIQPVARMFDIAMREKGVPPMIVVIVNGLPKRLWTDSKNGLAPVETVFISELIPHIDKSMRTISSRYGRILEGFSMGGYGAARIGFKHAGLFGGISILAAGPLNIEFEGPRATGNPLREKILKDVCGGDMAYFKATHPRTIAEAQAQFLRKPGTIIRQAVGDKDFSLSLNRSFHEHLDALKIPHEFQVVANVGHDATALLAGLDNAEFYRKALAPKKGGDNFKDIALRMQPYAGKHTPGVDTNTLKGKVMCGYQGWFAAEGDGSGRGWVHFGSGKNFDPGQCSIDFWPDMSEMDPDEKYLTKFKHKDGKIAKVFSSYNKKTVMRHFKWMKENGIDGVFLQRFGVSVKQPGAAYNHRNVVTANVQAGANKHGRTWAMMYDLSGLKPGEIDKVVMEDWKRLVDHMDITKDKSYLRHKGKPVVAVWGVGFRDGREYTLDECETLVRFLKNDPKYGGNTVMLGVPTYWRSLERDATNDEKLHRIISLADIVSPWTVGRYSTPRQAGKHAETVMRQDLEWCKKKQLDYLPVIFPGFSWQNLQKNHGKNATLDQIPRLKGEFMWSQATAFRKAGAEMLYVAMFDEIDEGTAIFKCTNEPPVGESKFVTYEGLPADHYLWLTGKIGELMRGKTKATAEMPIRKTSQKEK